MFTPIVAPVQLGWAGEAAQETLAFLPGRFVMAAASFDDRPSRSGVIAISYDHDAGRVIETPAYVVRYRGPTAPAVVGVAAEKDGLYFTHLLPDESGNTSILRAYQATGDAHPYVIGGGGGLFAQTGCTACHRRGGAGASIGPSLDFDNERIEGIERWLDSDEYASTVAGLDARTDAPYPQFASARADVLAASGQDRVSLWLRYRIQEPRFDDPNAQMPNLGIDAEVAQVLAQALLEVRGEPQPGLVSRLGNGLRDLVPFLPETREGDFAAGAVFGVIGGGGGLVVAWLALLVLRRRARSS